MALDPEVLTPMEAQPDVNSLESEGSPCHPSDGRKGSKGGKRSHFQDEEDIAAYNDPIYSTDNFRLNCFK